MKSSPPDPLHFQSGENEHWTTANLGEAMPGVATPLSVTVWGDSVDKGLLAAAVSLGAIAPREAREIGPPAIRVTRLFHGRAAVKADVLALIGDRMPGTTGEEVVRTYFGSVPETMDLHPTRRRYPVVAARLPWTFATHPRRVRSLAADWDAWWPRSVAAVPGLTRGAAARQLTEAVARLEAAVIVQSVAVIACVQPAYDALSQAIESVDQGEDLSLLLSVPGGAESAVVQDIWKASRGELPIEAITARHGFHGPSEGELSATVWREDDAPLRRMVSQYAGMDESEAPDAREAALRAERSELESKLLAAASPAARPGIRVLLRLAEPRVALRGVAKRSMLQALDVARASARRLGEELAAAGVLDQRDDVFFLTVAEATGPQRPDLADVVAIRREQRTEHARFSIPEHWRGNPEEVLAREAAASQSTVEGEGVSAGAVTGTARVVLDPSFTDVEPDEVLVAPTTDPSWSAIMFVSKALIVDIGGELSHAAVVARELGIPCVVNTRNGTATIRTGDRVRVDGEAGTVEILERASESRP